MINVEVSYLRTAQTERLAAGSIPVVTSSRNITRGQPSIERARESFRRFPPESLADRVLKCWPDQEGYAVVCSDQVLTNPETSNYRIHMLLMERSGRVQPQTLESRSQLEMFFDLL